MRRFIVFLCLFILGYFSFSQTESRIDFVIKNVGINVDGHFNEFNILGIFNPEGKLRSVSGEIKVASIETGIESRDEHLLEDDYFDGVNHPKITLVGISGIEKADGVYDFNCDLTIKGTTRKITIPVEVVAEGDYWKIKSNFQINRRDFDVGGGSFVLSKTVKIEVVHYQPIE